MKSIVYFKKPTECYYTVNFNYKRSIMQKQTRVDRHTLQTMSVMLMNGSADYINSK